jgi:hypothetical protein
MSYLCLQWACVQWAMYVSSELSVSPVSNLCLQWAICVSSELSVPPVSCVGFQLAICVSSELSMSPISFLCPQWTICISSELFVFPLSYPLFNELAMSLMSCLNTVFSELYIFVFNEQAIWVPSLIFRPIHHWKCEKSHEKYLILLLNAKFVL